MRKFVYILLMAIFVGIPTVKADTFYINDNGVEFTEEQYVYITNMFYNGYQNHMTQDEFDRIANLDLFNKPIEVISVPSDPYQYKEVQSRGTSVTEKGRTTTIARSCSSECLVTLNAVWSIIPTVQSNDVIGFRLTSGTINTINKASVNGSGYYKSYNSSYAQTSGNGFGYSLKLGNASNMIVSTSMYCTPGGTVYGSYQHAMSSISYANSKKYTIGAGGYGYVFNFYGAAVGKYDNAVGVYTTL